jgi:hypothetical protein
MESVSTQNKSLKAMLAERQYRRRIILLYGRDDAQHFLLQQQQTLKAAQPDLDDRQTDVIVLVASELQEPDRQFLMGSAFRLNPANDFQGWLIGKDGGVKQQFTRPVDPADLFRLVDSMPMRKRERSQKQ